MITVWITVVGDSGKTLVHRDYDVLLVDLNKEQAARLAEGLSTNIEDEIVRITESDKDEEVIQSNKTT
jgi:hypothetical protein